VTNKPFIRDIVRPLVVLVGAVMLWRGTWGLLNIYMFPESPELSALLSFVIGLVILVMSRNLKYMVGVEE